jgi:predicted DNA-binding transcriptional regulator AlpA
MPLDTYLTLAELRQRLRISRATWQRLQTRGDVPRVVRIGRRVIVPLSAVEVWLTGKTAPAAA